MPAPLISLLPTAPDIGSPLTFPALATAFVAAQANMAPELNAYATYFNGFAPAQLVQTFVTKTGTANAWVITTGLGLASITTGLKFRFKSTLTNTGASTVAIDGLAAVAVQTVRATALPSSYVRNDLNAETTLTFNGTVWIASREPMYGTGVNGDFMQLENGYQVCSNNVLPTTNISTADGQIFRSLSIAFTFERVFVGVPQITGQADDQEAWISSGIASTSSVQIRGKSSVTKAGAVNLRARAEGLWY